MSAESANQQVLIPSSASETAVSGVDSFNSGVMPTAVAESMSSAPITHSSFYDNEDRSSRIAKATDGESPVPGEISVPSHEHGDRAKNMSFEEALGATGCSYLRSVATTQGKEAAKKAFDAVRPADSDKPTKLVMPPSKKKTEAPQDTKKFEAPKSQVKPDAAKVVVQSRPTEESRPITPPPAEVRTNAAQVVTETFIPLVEAVPLVAKRIEEVTPIAIPTEQLMASATQATAAALERLSLSELVTAPASSVVTPEPNLVGTATEESQEKEGLTVTIDTETVEPAMTVSGETSRAPATAVLEANGLGAERKSPATAFYRFAEALNLLTHEVSPQTLDEPTEFSNEYLPLEPPVAVVATEVADRLMNLTIEQKEIVPQIVQSITESVQAIRQLQHEAGTPRKIIAAVEEMRQQIVQLFEAIDIEYDGQKIEYFIQAMLWPSFAIRGQIFLTPEELAKMGTREVKVASQFAAFLSHTADGTPTLQGLGEIMLFFMHLPLAWSCSSAIRRAGSRPGRLLG